MRKILAVALALTLAFTLGIPFSSAGIEQPNGDVSYEKFRELFYEGARVPAANDFGIPAARAARAAFGPATIYVDKDIALHEPPLREQPELEDVSASLFSAFAAADAEINHPGPYEAGDSRYFVLSNRAIKANLAGVGEHSNIWVFDDEDYHIQNNNTCNPSTCWVKKLEDSPEEAQDVANNCDGVYERMTDPVTGFGAHAGVLFESTGRNSYIGDIDLDGKINILYYDFSSYGSFASSAFRDTYTHSSGRVIHPIDMINISSRHYYDPVLVYGTLAHEFQHMLWHMYIEAYEIDGGYDSWWLNEALSGFAEIYYLVPGAEILYRPYIDRAAPNPYTGGSGWPGDFLHFDNDKGYGMGNLFSMLLDKKTNGTFACNLYKSLRSNGNGLQEKLDYYSTYTIDEYLGKAFKYALGSQFDGFTDKQVHDYLYYVFMESVAADGGTVVSQGGEPFSSPKLIRDTTVDRNNMWYLRYHEDWGNWRPSYGAWARIPTIETGGNVVLTGYGSNRLPTNASITYGGALRGASHEMLYKIGESPDPDAPVIRIEMPDGPGLDGGMEYYVVIPNDTYGGQRPVVDASPAFESGATVYHMKKGQPNLLNTKGGVAYLYVVTLYNNVNTTVDFSWEALRVVEATPAAFVKQLAGSQNELTITITEKLSDGTENVLTETLKINNNAAGTYEVGGYSVYVDTKGNTQVRECRIVD